MAKAATDTKALRTIVKKVDGVCALFSDGTIRLDNVRLSYPWVGKAQKNTDDDGNESESYSCVAILPKATHRAAMQMCRDAIAKLEATKPAVKGKPFKVGADKKFIKDGDATERDEDGNPTDERKYQPEYAGSWFVSARERNRPQVRGPDIDPKTGKVRRLTAAEAVEKFYGGCYGTMIVRPWLQDNKYGKRINAGLVAVQFLEDGEPFGEGRIGEEEIDDSFDGTENDSGGWDDDDNDL